MRLRLSPALVRSALDGHSWLGLMVGGLMYLVCLSGALLVFHAELERWEQPGVNEFDRFDLAAVERAFNAAVLDPDFVTEHMYLILPTRDLPRLRIASENASYFLNADGSRGLAEQNGFTEMLVKLHLYLHLPESWGMVLVSTLGALLVGLIISGVLAHPKIFRDAFALRLGSNRRLTQTDIHNRLSVWGLPFHLLIAVTGAYFGLVLISLGVFAELIHDGDRAAIADSLFSPDPVSDSAPGPVNLAGPLGWLERNVPEASPDTIIVHDAGQTGQHLSISATHPGRLIYGENYRFDAAGNFLRSDGYADGPVGKQVVYSIYQLHFGWFAGFFGKLAYALLGLALASVSVTGVNIWLARRGEITPLNDAWAGIVWGTPLALTTAALGHILFGLPAALVLWSVLLAATIAALAWRNPVDIARRLQGLLMMALLGLAAGHSARFGIAAFTGIGLAGNLLFTALAAVIGLWLYRSRSPQGARDVLVKTLYTENQGKVHESGR